MKAQKQISKCMNFDLLRVPKDRKLKIFVLLLLGFFSLFF